MREILIFDTNDEYTGFITEKRLEDSVRYIAVGYDDIHKCLDCKRGEYKCKQCEDWEPWVVDIDDLIIWQSKTREAAIEVALFLSQFYRCGECEGLFFLPADHESTQPVPMYCSNCEGED